MSGKDLFHVCRWGFEYLDHLALTKAIGNDDHKLVFFCIVFESHLKTSINTECDGLDARNI